VTRERSSEIIGRVEPHRRGAIEQAGQVPADEATQRVPDKTAVLGQPALGVVMGIGVQ